MNKNLRITVNGVAYDVTVQDMGDGEAAAASAPIAAAPAPTAAPAAPAAAPKAAAAEGEPVKSPMPGTVLEVKVKEGDTVKSGDTVIVLEAMKMENAIVAPRDATIASVNVTRGQSVESGAVLVTLG